MSKPSDGKKQTIMICDDESDILIVFSEVLKSEFNVLTANSGKECINKFTEEKKRGNRIDILLLDYKLGDMLGDQVAAMLHGFGDLKTVLITAYELDSRHVEDLKKQGLVADSIRKPISLQELLAKIKSL